MFFAAGSPGLDSDKPGTSLVDIQCLLDSVGATELVIDLIVSTKNDRVFEESILLGIALLWGGNTQIQVGTPIHTHIYSRYFVGIIFHEGIGSYAFYIHPPTLSLQNSFYHQLHKQKKSEKFFKVFYDHMQLAQKEIRSTVSVNMFEISCRKHEEEGEVSNFRPRKGRTARHTFII